MPYKLAPVECPMDACGVRDSLSWDVFFTVEYFITDDVSLWNCA